MLQACKEHNACIGLAFKPNIYDLGESSAVKAVEKLLNLGVNIIAIEPNIAYHDIHELRSFDQMVTADIIVILINYREFLRPQNKSCIKLKQCISVEH